MSWAESENIVILETAQRQYSIGFALQMSKAGELLGFRSWVET